MEGYAGVSETERMSVSNEGRPIPRWLEIQSGNIAKTYGFTDAHPIPHCPVTITLVLQSEGHLCCVSDQAGTDLPYIAANAATGAAAIRGRTSSWEIFDPELVLAR